MMNGSSAFDGKVKEPGSDLGATKEKIAEAAASQMGLSRSVFADSLEEAVEVCASTCRKPETRSCFHRPVQAGICSRAMRSAESSSRNL